MKHLSHRGLGVRGCTGFSLVDVVLVVVQILSGPTGSSLPLRGSCRARVPGRSWRSGRLRSSDPRGFGVLTGSLLTILNRRMCLRRGLVHNSSVDLGEVLGGLGTASAF